MAGVFYPFLHKEKRATKVLSLPLHFWDSHLDSEAKITNFIKTVKHLSKIGGVVSLLFHPGQFYNIEHPKMDGIYYRVLKIFQEFKAKISVTNFLIKSK